MLKKIANIWAQMTESRKDAITAAWSLKRGLMFDERFDLFLDDFSGSATWPFSHALKGTTCC